MPRKQLGESFSKQEAARRFEAALHGAFKTPAIPLRDIPRKRKKISKWRRKASASAS